MQNSLERRKLGQSCGHREGQPDTDGGTEDSEQQALTQEKGNRPAPSPSDGTQQPELSGSLEQRKKHGVAHDDSTNQDGGHCASVYCSLQVHQILVCSPELGSGTDGCQLWLVVGDSCRNACNGGAWSDLDKRQGHDTWEPVVSLDGRERKHCPGIPERVSSPVDPYSRVRRAVGAEAAANVQAKIGRRPQPSMT
jgi:hypothetical protein